MLFSSFLPASVTDPDFSRLALLDAILLDFQIAFPDLHFELRLDRKVINAQAILLDDSRCVLIYGGLALHPSLAEASLTFALLHEAGHHLATGPRLPFNVSLKCDCAADHWARTEGAETLRRVSGRQLQIAAALQQLDCLMSEPGDVSNFSEDSSMCWNRRWSDRKQGISAGCSPTKCELMRPVL